MNMCAVVIQGELIQDRTLHGLIGTHARSRPDSLALSFDDRSWTYLELEAEIKAVARALRGSGLSTGDRIAYLGKNSVEFALLWGGAARIGVVMVPLNWRLSTREFGEILADANAAALFIGAGFYSLGDELSSVASGLRFVVRCEEPSSFKAWIEKNAHVSDAVEPLGNDAVAVQLYTSGTTGKPKGVLLTHDSIFWQRAASALNNVQWDCHSCEDVLLVSLTVSHVGGLVTLARAIFSGAHAVILPEFDVSTVLDAIARWHVSRLALVPSALQMLIRDPRVMHTNTTSVKIVQYGASPIPLDLLKQSLEVFRCDFAQAYGMTETGGTIAMLAPVDHDVLGNDRMKSIGTPLPGVDMRIVDSSGAHVALGVIGEIQVRTRAMMIGYWNLPLETAKAMTADGFLRTGDAGYMDEHGYIYLCDRIKDMIVTGAENVYPAEVENAIYAHPDVLDVAVIGIPDDRWGEAVKAVVVRKPGSAASAEELMEFARTQIARFKVPKSIDFMAELPRNAAGKVQRRALREPYWTGREKRIN